MVELAKTVHEERQSREPASGSAVSHGSRSERHNVASSLQHSEQRVGVFVDVQNLYYSAKNVYGAKVNFSNILKAAVGRRKLVRAIAYVIRADVKDEQNFFDALENIGFEVKAKDLQVFFGGAKKGDWDIGIAMDTIELSPKLDTIILVSGDGDYQPLVQHLRRAMCCRVEVVAFGKSASSKLVEEADSFFDLDTAPAKFLMRG
ncbi:NYN domain-containing protein [Candidatus Woesearchaeota archaeon]|nr:NYN domain-containing protein [Candidatus Woesearchaeota archaeon]